MAGNELLDVSKQVTDVLDYLDLPHVYGGSVASTVHGAIKADLSAHLLTPLTYSHLAPFTVYIKNDFHVDDNAIRQAITRCGTFDLIHLTTMYKISIQVPSSRAFAKSLIDRRISCQIKADSVKSIWVLSVEDLILNELDLLQSSNGSFHRHWQDILNLVKSGNAHLDVQYLRMWADELRFNKLLKRALKGDWTDQLPAIPLRNPNVKPVIRREKFEDQSSVYSVVHRAFGSIAEADLVEALRPYSKHIISLVAEVEDQIIGHITFSPVKVNGSSSLAIGPISVLPDYQNRGIGTRLITTGLKVCRKLGKTCVFVLGNPSFYTRFGFVMAATHDLYYRNSEMDAHFMVMEFIPNSLHSLSGEVKYLPVFDSV